MWNVKPKVIPVIIGTTGAISESLRKYLSNIMGKHEIKERQNSHIGHCKHTAENSNVKVQNTLHGRNNITCRTNCQYKTAVILYTPETWFVSGM